MNVRERIGLLFQMIFYNLKIVFSGKFIFFLLAAWGFFLLMMGIMLFSNDTYEFTDVYDSLLFTGILIFFYPVVYNIQNDKDARMLEIIFGVPDYRYRVYLLRFIIAMLLMVFMLIIMSAFTWFTVLLIPVGNMVFHLCFTLFFLACLTFLFTSLIKNANGAAVVMIIVGVIIFILDKIIKTSKWNPFLNPYNNPSDMDITIWTNVVEQNRIILFIGAVITLFWGLINLQRREKFV